MAALQPSHSRAHSRPLAACVTFFALTSLATPPADATTFEDLTLEQLAAQSDVVAIGTVIATEAYGAGPSGRAGARAGVPRAPGARH